MLLPHPLVWGILIQRYKRFLADVKLRNGHIVTAHCPNSGSLLSCNIPGNTVILSKSDNPKRKLKYTWEQIKVDSVWVGINTHYPNKLVIEGISNGIIKEFKSYSHIQQEVKIGENSRIDIVLEGSVRRCYIEVKNVTYVENNIAMFPDAVTTRGQKHLQELLKLSRQGNRAVILFVIQRNDGFSLKSAEQIDPEFSKILRYVFSEGVEVMAYQAAVSPQEIYLSHRIPVLFK
jgi:sugar fermentation stimulation protein A